MLKVMAKKLSEIEEIPKEFIEEAVGVYKEYLSLWDGMQIISGLNLPRRGQFRVPTMRYKHLKRSHFPSKSIDAETFKQGKKIYDQTVKRKSKLKDKKFDNIPSGPFNY